MHQEYLPSHLSGEEFLQKPGDISGKTWDEDMLKRWEQEHNDGLPWEGRNILNDTKTTAE